MKKTLLSSALLASLLLIGCGGGGSNGSNDNNGSNGNGNGNGSGNGTDIQPTNEQVIKVGGKEWTVVKTQDVSDDPATTDVNETFYPKKNWSDAVAYCEDIVDPDSTWSLPTKSDIESLLTDLNTSDADVQPFADYNHQVLNDINSSFVWLKDDGVTDENNNQAAWIAYMGGHKLMKYAKTKTGYVTCVKAQ